MSKKTPAYKLQAIVTEGSWPYVGNGYLNQDGSISLLLDRAVVLELRDGRRLAADDAHLVKLRLRRPFAGTPAAQAPEETASTAEPTPAADSPGRFYSGVHIFG